MDVESMVCVPRPIALASAVRVQRCFQTVTLLVTFQCIGYPSFSLKLHPGSRLERKRAGFGIVVEWRRRQPDLLQAFLAVRNGRSADGKRDVPDVSLTAAGHDGYLIYQEGSLYVVGGTSAATPAFAGIMALVAEHAAARLGNANVALYSLATMQGRGGASIFHDITQGNNSVPGQTGFLAATGYDQATGLGSVDALVLVNHFGDATQLPSFHVTSSASSVTLAPSSNKRVTFTVTVSGSFDAPVSFSIAGLPTGVSAAFTPATLPAPGSGSSALKIAAASTAKAGTYSATISVASKGSPTQTVSLSITVGG